MTKKIAIIGSGISGLTCAYLLAEKHSITLYEANDYIGGHTATKQVTKDEKDYFIDTGFIVFNDWTYPNFIELLGKLGVEKQPTQMSFSVSNEISNIEYNGHTPNSLFAQRRNIFRPRFWRIVRDILVFNKACKNLIASGDNTENHTLSDFIAQLELSEDFSQNYILPMCASIWSASIEQTKAFPLNFFLQFFNNHGLLNIVNRPQWYTIKGGSHSYIAPMIKKIGNDIRLNTAVISVAQDSNGITILDSKGSVERYDEVIFSCHSDQALSMIKTPTADQTRILGAIPYAENKVTLHTDINQLPKRKKAWASWNYKISENSNKLSRPVSVTYNMNILQRLSSQHTFCVSLNNTDLDEDKILGTYTYSHPQFSKTMVSAQQDRGQICGIGHFHFCGAYWYNGFHEDGVKSALDVCKRFGVTL